MDKTLNDLFTMGYNDDFRGFKNANKQSYISPLAVTRLNEIKASTLIVTAEHDMEPCIVMADQMRREIKK